VLFSPENIRISVKLCYLFQGVSVSGSVLTLTVINVMLSAPGCVSVLFVPGCVSMLSVPGCVGICLSTHPHCYQCYVICSSVCPYLSQYSPSLLSVLFYLLQGVSQCYLFQGVSQCYMFQNVSVSVSVLTLTVISVMLSVPGCVSMSYVPECVRICLSTHPHCYLCYCVIDLHSPISVLLCYLFQGVSVSVSVLTLTVISVIMLSVPGCVRICLSTHPHCYQCYYVICSRVCPYLSQYSPSLLSVLLCYLFQGVSVSVSVLTLTVINVMLSVPGCVRICLSTHPHCYLYRTFLRYLLPDEVSRHHTPGSIHHRCHVVYLPSHPPPGRRCPRHSPEVLDGTADRSADDLQTNLGVPPSSKQ